MYARDDTYLITMHGTIKHSNIIHYIVLLWLQSFSISVPAPYRGRQHIAGRKPNGFFSRFNLLREPFLWLSPVYSLSRSDLTTRIFPSHPGWISITRANVHLIGARGPSLKHTISPTWRFLDGVCHFEIFKRVSMYSFDQRVHQCLVNIWHSGHRLNGVSCWWTASSGRAVSGLPIRKWPGVNTSSASDGSGMGARGLEFKHASICTAPS